MMIYICHPYTSGGPNRALNVAENRSRIYNILHSLRNKHGDEHVFVSPVHCFSWLDPCWDEEDNDARRMCLELLGVCEAVWCFGDWESSRGCCDEVAAARASGLPVLYEGEVWIK